MTVTLSGALLTAPAKTMAGGMDKRPSVMMEVRRGSPGVTLSLKASPWECMGTPTVLMSLQRDTVPTRVFPLAQGRWAASTALKTLSLITAAGDLSCVAPSSEYARKGACGVGRSLPAKVTRDLLPGQLPPAVSTPGRFSPPYLSSFLTPPKPPCTLPVCPQHPRHLTRSLTTPRLLHV